MHFKNITHAQGFYAGPKHQGETLNHKWVFSQAYHIYYNLFIAWAEIKSWKLLYALINMRNFIKAKEYDMNMHENIKCMILLGFL
jgi:hypothetical protein